MNEAITVALIFTFGAIAIGTALYAMRVAKQASDRAASQLEQTIAIARHAVDAGTHIATTNAAATVDLVDKLVTPPPVAAPAQNEPAPDWTMDDVNAGWEDVEPIADPFDEVLPDAQIENIQRGLNLFTDTIGPVVSGQVYVGEEDDQ